MKENILMKNNILYNPSQFFRNLFPVIQEFLQSRISKRVLKQLINNCRWTRCDMSACKCAFFDMNRMSNGSSKNLCFKAIIFIQLFYFHNQIHSSLTNVLK